MRRQIDSVAAMIIGVGLNVLSGLVVARALGPSGRGVMVAMTLVPTAANVLIGLGLPAANVFVVSRDRSRAAGAAGMSVLWSVCLPLFAAVVLYRLGALGIVGGALHLGAVTTVTVLAWSPMLLAYQQLNGVVQGTGDYAVIRTGRTVQGAAILAGSVALALVHATGPMAYFLAWIGSYGVGAVYYLAVVTRRHGLRLPVARDAHATLKYGVRAVWTQMWELVNFRGDQFFVASLASSSVLGIYSLAVGMSELLMHVPTALSHVVFSNTAAGEQGSREQTLRTAARVFGLASAVGAIMFVGCALLLRLALGDGYASVWAVFGVLALPTALLASGRMLGAFEMGVGRPGVPGTAAAVSLAVTLALDAVLVPRLGALGAGLSCGIGYLLAASYLIGTFARGTGLAPLRQMFRGLAEVPATVSRIVEMVRP